MRSGFEALADATLLVLVLLAASSALAGFAASPGPRTAIQSYAEDTRLALFRSTLDGLWYEADGAQVDLLNGTNVETFLRLEVHLLATGKRGFDFSAANARIADLTNRLVRPAWAIVIVAGTTHDADLVRIPDRSIPSEHAAAFWVYPPLDEDGVRTRLGIALWFSPPR